jgi:signal transduction histidine kinase
MKVKHKLSFQFTFMFAVLLLAVLVGIYLFAQRNRVQTFYSKLDDRALTVGQFYLAEDNLSRENFQTVLKKFPQSLSGETLRIYNDRFQPQFIPQGNVHWDLALLKHVVTQKKVHFWHGNAQATAIYYIDNSGNYIIVVSAIDDSGYHYLHDLGLIMFFFFLASLAITFVMGNVFSRISLQPIVKISNNLKRIRSSSLDLRLPVVMKKPDEIDTLSITINQLLEHLEQSFENQRSFISSASHELRTPITTILGEAETTLLFDRSKDEYQIALVNIVKETDRLVLIINSLMELVQTDSANFEFKPVRMDELLWEITDELGTDNIDVNYDLPPNCSKYTIQGNRGLLLMGIKNVLKNAVKFSAPRKVYCRIFCNEKGVNIIVRDKGIGIDPKDVSRIFQPFFRAPNALNYAGHGIGLSLTRNVLKLHNGLVDIKSNVGRGTEFHLTFPN